MKSSYLQGIRQSFRLDEERGGTARVHFQENLTVADAARERPAKALIFRDAPPRACLPHTRSASGKAPERALRVSAPGQITAASLLSLTVPFKLSTKVSENRWTDPRNDHRNKPATTENPDVEDA